MSVAFESNNTSDTNRIQLPGFSHRMWIYNMSESGKLTGGNSWTSSLPAVKEEEHSNCSSSIGTNSDAFSGGGDSDEDVGGEVQSKANGPLNSLNDLENALPIKKGISTFYSGKSKSYGSLADAVSTPSINGIVKPEDAYSRKRKIMRAHRAYFDDKHGAGQGFPKRIARNIDDSHENGGSSNSSTCMAGLSRPPLPQTSRKRSTNNSSDSSDSSFRLYRRSPWRSLSLSDLQDASSINGVSDKGKEVDGDDM